MPAYDVSLSDFLQYAQTNKKQKDQVEEFFPLLERIEMTKRICDGLLYMNKEKSIAHRDIKLRMVSTTLFFLVSDESSLSVVDQAASLKSKDDD